MGKQLRLLFITRMLLLRKISSTSKVPAGVGTTATAGHISLAALLYGPQLVAHIGVGIAAGMASGATGKKAKVGDICSIDSLTLIISHPGV